MKYTIERVVQGVIEFADAEIMDKLPLSGRWVMGTFIGMASNKARNIAESLKDNPVVSMLDIIDDEDKIDAEELLNAMQKSADRYGSITMDIPLVGRLTFSSDDISHLRNYIV